MAEPGLPKRCPPSSKCICNSRCISFSKDENLFLETLCFPRLEGLTPLCVCVCVCRRPLLSVGGSAEAGSRLIDNTDRPFAIARKSEEEREWADMISRAPSRK